MPEKRPSLHTVPNPKGGWDNIQSGRTISHHDRKEEAVDCGRQEAMRERIEHIIHNQNGQIADSNSYGHDPYPTLG